MTLGIPKDLHDPLGEHSFVAIRCKYPRFSILNRVPRAVVHVEGHDWASVT
jgi:hypothetical protein